MGLEKYWRKRDFGRTPEPVGEPGPDTPSVAGRLAFVVQKHDASRLHYDFRLELQGTLKSWAVPKGPSLDPAEKRLAVEVEDHPLAYRDFEGKIPAGEYGAGTVLVWDCGEWMPEGDPLEAYRRGRLHFRLEGEKLKGEWALVRMWETKNWLLMKLDDAFSRQGEAAEITEQWRESVKTGRELEEVAADDNSPVFKEKTDTSKTEDRHAALQRRTVAPVKVTRKARAATAMPEFVGLREDKPTDAVGREKPIPLSDNNSTQRKTKTSAATHSDTIAGVAITHPDRVLFVEGSITKRDIAHYYERIASRLLPHIKERPLAVVRCPRGTSGSCFFQRHLTNAMPDSLHAVTVQEREKSALYMTADTLPAVIGLVQMGVLELHTWNARRDRLDRPDRMIFDLDPAPDLPWNDFVESARVLHALLQDLELPAFLKTTGGKGLHVETPLQRVHDWDTVKGFAQAVATQLAEHLSDRFIAKAGKEERHGKVFVDWLRNVEGATAVAAYSTRARPGVPVAVPIAWEKLPEVRSASFNVGNIFHRLDQLRQEPWKEYEKSRVRLSQHQFYRLGLNAPAT